MCGYKKSCDPAINTERGLSFFDIKVKKYQLLKHIISGILIILVFKYEHLYRIY